MPPSAAGDQFYVTHCTTADSVLNDPGYTVRAASSNNRAALQASFRYPPYELPIEMWRDLPQVSGAPRRLALTGHPEDPDGKRWVVHSAYLAKDTVDRDRSYFSHLIRLDDADPVAVLRSWNSDGWVKSYPQGASKTLPGNFRVPDGKFISDATLTAFLGDTPPGPTELSTTICPPRLRASAQTRRELLARALQAFVLLDAEPNEQRRRLYIHAEPGVVALLLYGAFRLLPGDVVDGLTFTTFEPYHRNIRNYKLAEVVGTYLGSMEKGLEPDFGTSRGIALDTIKPTCSSAKLSGPVQGILSQGINDLVELAARGEWNLLPAVHRAVGRDADGLPLVGRAVLRARGLAKVDDGKAAIDELLAIQEDASGAAELRGRADKVWPVVRAAALDPRRADVRRAFHDLLADPDRIKEVWEEAVEAILKEQFDRWDVRWQLVREVAGRETATKLLNKFVGNEKNEERLSRLSTDIRSKMRRACGEVAMLPPRPLLVPVGLGELEPLLTAPPDWAGYTAFVLLANDKLGWLSHIPAGDRPAMRKRAREFLFSGPAPAIGAYVHAARPYLDTSPAFLESLFKPYSPAAAQLMDKLLTTTVLEPGDWMKLRTSVGLTQDQWGDFLLEKDRLGNFLFALGGDGTGAEVWDDYLGLLTNALVSPDLITTADGTDPKVVHDWERKVHGHLKAAADRLTNGGHRLAAALPKGGIGKLFAANNLLKWVSQPATAERDGPEEVRTACERFEIDKLALVRVAYKKGGYDRLDLPAELPKLEPIIQLFSACYPVDSQYHTARTAVTYWLKLSESCPKQSRAVFQAAFVTKVVPDNHYEQLLGEQRQQPFEPYAVTAIRQAMSQPKRPTGPKYAAPGARAAAAAPAARPAQTAEDVGLADEAAEPVAEEEGDGVLPVAEEPRPTSKPRGASASRSNKPGRGKGKKGDSNKMIIVGAVVGGVLLIGGAVALIGLGGKSDPVTKKDESATPKKNPEPAKPDTKSPADTDAKKKEADAEAKRKKDEADAEAKRKKDAEDAEAKRKKEEADAEAKRKKDAEEAEQKKRDEARKVIEGKPLLALTEPVRYPKRGSPVTAEPPKTGPKMDPKKEPDPAAALEKAKAVVPKITNKLPHLRLWH
jgi:hypothetical protein